MTEVIHLNEEALDGATVGELRDVHGLDDDDDDDDDDGDGDYDDDEFDDEILIRRCEFEFGFMHVS